MRTIHDLPEWALPLHAAAWQSYDELRKEPPLCRADVVTVDEQLARDAARTALEIIYDYAVKEPAVRSRMGSGESVRRHVVRSLCLTEMRGRWSNAWRDTPAQERAFNSACRVMRWFKSSTKVSLSLRGTVARDLGISPGDKDKITVPGVLLTDERLAELEAYLFGGDDLPPVGGKEPEVSPASPGRPPAFNAAETLVSPCPPEAIYPRDTTTIDMKCPTRVPAHIQGKGDYLEGAAAITAVRAILAEPGPCSIDFETYPTDPAWHAERAAATAPKGKKGAAREKARRIAELNGRAHLRRPCVLALAHASGAEVLVRLTPGDDPTPRRVELAAMFEGRVADLVAFNAQFECEILLAHGVPVDIDCTLLAAKSLYLVAVPEDAPQPVDFGLADLVEREFGRQRDKTIRDRDWRLEESLDEEAIEYGLQDARDALQLWQLYRDRLEAEGLFEGYRVIVRATLPTAATNLAGMVFDTSAHHTLVSTLRAEASRLEGELAWICGGAVANPASPAQIGTWAMEAVLKTPIAPPVEPRLVGLLEFLKQQGGLRPDRGGELAARDLPKGLLGLAGKLSLEDATIAAWDARYISHEHDRWSVDGTRPEQDDLLAAIDREVSGDRVLSLEDHATWDAYQVAKDHYDRLHRDDPERYANFCARLQARCGTTWKRTKSGALAITKQRKPQLAEALADEFPVVSRYLLTHVQWTKATKLLGTFGESLAHWIDDDGRLRGQLKMAGTVTMRHSASRPNTQQLPREAEFRGLFRAPPGRALIVCDYDQVELRVLAIVARDEALLAVYREGRDVHTENAAIVGLERKPAKGVSFGIAYVAGPSGLAEATGISLEKAADALDRFLTAYPAVARYREEAPREAEAAGYIAIRPGRRVRYDPALSRATQGINFVIQGGCASVMMRALRRVYGALAARPELEAHLVGAIHDEILLEAPLGAQAEAAAEILQEQMRAALVEIFPEAVEMGADRLAKATICQSWAEKG